MHAFACRPQRQLHVALGQLPFSQQAGAPCLLARSALQASLCSFHAMRWHADRGCRSRVRSSAQPAARAPACLYMQLQSACRFLRLHTDLV